VQRDWMCPVLLLAAVELPDPNSYASMGWIIAGIFGIVGLANQGIALWDRMFPRKSPPDNEVYATKAELAKARQEHQDSDKRIEDRFEQWMIQEQKQHSENLEKFEDAMIKFSQWQLMIERALGHVETKADVAMGREQPGQDKRRK